MENRKIRINEKEAETVQLIFRKYIGGTALKKIADYLTLCKTEYMPEKKTMEQKLYQKNY